MIAQSERGTGATGRYLKLVYYLLPELIRADPLTAASQYHGFKKLAQVKFAATYTRHFEILNPNLSLEIKHSIFKLKAFTEFVCFVVEFKEGRKFDLIGRLLDG